jgi:hypothetical protein
VTVAAAFGVLPAKPVVGALAPAVGRAGAAEVLLMMMMMVMMIKVGDTQISWC